MSRAFLVLHGYTNRRPEGHWQRRLVTTLRSEGELVVYPALPDTDDPHLDPWVDVVNEPDTVVESGYHCPVRAA